MFLCDFLFLSSSSSSATAIDRFWVEQDKKKSDGQQRGGGEKVGYRCCALSFPRVVFCPPPTTPTATVATTERPSAHPRSNADTHTGQRRRV